MTLPGICRAVLQIYFILSFSNLSQLFHYFPEPPPSCFRASSAPPHTCAFTMAILADPFHPSCLKSPAGSSSIISQPSQGYWASAPLRFPSPHTALQLPRYIPNKSCCGFPAYLSFSPVRCTSENFCPPGVGICAKLCSQQ